MSQKKELTSIQPVSDGQTEESNSVPNDPADPNRRLQSETTARFYRSVKLTKIFDNKLKWLQHPNSRPLDEIKYFSTLTESERTDLLTQAEALYQAKSDNNIAEQRSILDNLGIAGDIMTKVVEGLSPDDLENIKRIQNGELGQLAKSQVLKEVAGSLLSVRNILHPIQLVDKLKSTYELSGYTPKDARLLAAKTTAAIVTSAGYNSITSGITGSAMLFFKPDLPDNFETPLAKVALVAGAGLLHAGVIWLSNQIPKSDLRLSDATNGLSIEPEKVIAYALGKQLFPENTNAQTNTLRVAHWSSMNPLLPIPKGIEEGLYIPGDLLNPIGALVGHTATAAAMGGRIVLQNGVSSLFERNKSRITQGLPFLPTRTEIKTGILNRVNASKKVYKDLKNRFNRTNHLPIQ